MAQIGTYKHVIAGGTVVIIPVFSQADVSYSACRIGLPNGVKGFFNLVTPDSSTPLRIMTANGVMGITGTIAEAVNLIDISQYTLTNSSVVTLTANTVDYLQVQTPNNGHGIIVPFTSQLAVGSTYTLDAQVEILTTVDDRTTFHIRNVTQNKYIKTNVANTNATTGSIQHVTGTFSPNSNNYTPGDVIQLQAVQFWQNSTHDSMEWRLYKDVTVT